METQTDIQTDRVIKKETEINLNCWETLCLLFNRKTLILTSYLGRGRRGDLMVSALDS